MNESLASSSESTAPNERVTTTLWLSAPAEAVWQCLMFYEDVPRRPWPLLRLLLPQPLRSEGDKLTEGSPIRCSYDRGHLIKRITRVEPARRLEFEVLEQELGIERFGRACHGSYQLSRSGNGTQLELLTAYQGRMRPRFLWRWLERYLCHRLHQHILLGMSERLQLEHAALGLTAPEAERADTAEALPR